MTTEPQAQTSERERLDLKPCPMCGTELVPHSAHPDFATHPYNKRHCWLASAMVSANIPEHVQSWNTRADAETIQQAKLSGADHAPDFERLTGIELSAVNTSKIADYYTKLLRQRDEQLAAQSAELERVRKDAERYRYAQENLDVGMPVLRGGVVRIDQWNDARIDAALAAGGEKEGETKCRDQ